MWHDFDLADFSHAMFICIVNQGKWDFHIQWTFELHPDWFILYNGIWSINMMMPASAEDIFKKCMAGRQVMFYLVYMFKWNVNCTEHKSKWQYISYTNYISCLSCIDQSVHLILSGCLLVCWRRIPLQIGGQCGGNSEIQHGATSYPVHQLLLLGNLIYFGKWYLL